MTNEKKEKPVSEYGLILNGAGKTVDVFPADLKKKWSDPDGALRSMMREKDASRLSDFCAVSPVPSRDRTAAAANSASFRLDSRLFSYGIAVKDRRFSGSYTVVYLVSKSDAPRVPPFYEWRFPDDLLPLLSPVGFGRETPPDHPLGEVSLELSRRIGLATFDSLFRLTSSVVKRISAYPETVCGEIAPVGKPDDGPLGASVPAGVYAALLALLVSTLNSSSEGRMTGIEIIPRGEAAEIRLTAENADRELADAFSSSLDVLSLASRLPFCLERLSLASCLSSASGIPVDLTDGGAGFSLTLYRDSPDVEFKDLVPFFDADAVVSEIDRFIADRSVV